MVESPDAYRGCLLLLPKFLSNNNFRAPACKKRLTLKISEESILWGPPKSYTCRSAQKADRDFLGLVTG